MLDALLTLIARFGLSQLLASLLELVL